jgi:hypothetical protein
MRGFECRDLGGASESLLVPQYVGAARVLHQGFYGAAGQEAL